MLSLPSQRNEHVRWDRSSRLLNDRVFTFEAIEFLPHASDLAISPRLVATLAHGAWRYTPHPNTKVTRLPRTSSSASGS